MSVRRAWSWGVALIASLSTALAQETGPVAGPAKAAAEPPPWRWSSDKRKPFLDWHTDAALQRAAYDEACEAMCAATGLRLAERVDVAIVPVEAIPFISMESGAKSGALKHGHTLT